ncbi:hypothetical protein JDV09_19025 [Mycobacterium sp. Y57]|uniref:hypothetical protein n=1 Tax=Mycolicibacterium xanthum TaxID=2796469 RepID=UPI001C842F09|nr:hypothetical protein [Mycolicibacterium xanthum]MBX7434185.1 hypothetical protein [Mycolicibacterium xanthum]
MAIGIDELIGAVHLAIGQPERYIEASRTQPASGRGIHAMMWAHLSTKSQSTIVIAD